MTDPRFKLANINHQHIKNITFMILIQKLYVHILCNMHRNFKWNLRCNNIKIVRSSEMHHSNSINWSYYILKDIAWIPKHHVKRTGIILKFNANSQTLSMAVCVQEYLALTYKIQPSAKIWIPSWSNHDRVRYRKPPKFRLNLFNKFKKTCFDLNKWDVWIMCYLLI